MIVSVITATYNRRKELTCLFESLVAQHYSGIEWIVIDDGGSDGTEQAVREFCKPSGFEIRYLRQQNAGKDAAVNRGLDMVTGDLVTVIDDDDYFLPDVFAQIANDFRAIESRQDVGGLSYLHSRCERGSVGSYLPHDRMISDHYECRINKNIHGDKCEFTKLAAFRDHNIRYVVTGAAHGLPGDTPLLMEIANVYRTCYINLPVLVKRILWGWNLR